MYIRVVIQANIHLKFVGCTLLFKNWNKINKNGNCIYEVCNEDLVYIDGELSIRR